jgi:hypothetical protein
VRERPPLDPSLPRREIILRGKALTRRPQLSLRRERRLTPATWCLCGLLCLRLYGQKSFNSSCERMIRRDIGPLRMKNPVIEERRRLP